MNNEIPLARFSIEGQTAHRDGPDLHETIARAVALRLSLAIVLAIQAFYLIHLLMKPK